MAGTGNTVIPSHIFGCERKINFAGSIVRIAPNHLSINDHSAQKIVYGFGSVSVPSMEKDPRFFTPEVDHSMNILNECNKKEHARMRRIVSFAFSKSNLLDNEDVLKRRTDDFLDDIGHAERETGQRGINIAQAFNYVAFNIMGELCFGDSWELRLEEQPGQSCLVRRVKG